MKVLIFGASGMVGQGVLRECLLAPDVELVQTVPGKEITIRLKRFDGGLWQTFAQGVTDNDGRIPDLIPPGKILENGNYKLVFETRSYFEMQKIKGFYPEVEIQFTVFDDNHYHVPLLINPFGYSTYRGS